MENAKRMRRAIVPIQALFPDMTMRAFAMLCRVAEDEGRTVSEYTQITDLPMQTASAILHCLAGRDRSGRYSVERALLVRIRNPACLREVTYALSPAGHAMLDKMGQALAGVTAVSQSKKTEA